MKKTFLILSAVLMFATTLRAQSWTDWQKLGTGDVYCRIQKVPMPNSEVYFEINIEYKVNGNWVRSQSDKNTYINCANAYFVESNGNLRKSEENVYVKNEASKDFYFFRGTIKMQDSRTIFFNARLQIKPLWKDAIYFKDKIPVN